MAQALQDVGAPVASQATAEITLSQLYTALQSLAEQAEGIWCKAAERENRRARRYCGVSPRPDYSAEELLAESILELIGAPVGVMEAEVSRIAEHLAQREREIAA